MNSPEFWKDLFVLAADAMLLGEQGGTIVEANLEACRLTGYAREELLGRNISILFSSEEHRRVPLDYSSLYEGKQVRKSRHLSRRDGTLVPVEMVSKLMPEGHFQAILRDMTEVRRAEEALRLSEEKFAKAFRTSPDAMTINRIADGVYLEVNEGFCALTGYQAEEVVGRSSRSGDVGIWKNPSDRERVVAELSAHGAVRSFEASFLRKDGSSVQGLFAARVIEIQGVSCLLSITRDITEKHRLDEALRRAQKLEALGGLAGGIAHDFNNLLTGVFGYISQAQLHLVPDTEAWNDLELAQGVFDRVKALSHQLLTFAKGGAPKKALVKVDELLQQTATFALSGSTSKVDLRLDNDLWPCEADAHQLGQVFDNLLFNARDAMPHGGTVVITARNVEASTLWTAALVPGPYVVIRVSDHGKGIAPENLGRVFDPFFTTKAHGSGLGLATAFSIVQRHGGLISVTSSLGQGSHFEVCLPASPGQQVPTPVPLATPITSRSGWVLLVDDEAFIRDIGAKILRATGFQVVTASDGDQAVAAFEQALKESQPFRVAILDLTLPGGEGGVVILQRLQQLDPRLVAIASSGYSDDPVMAAPERYGFQASLAKPYATDDLRRVLFALM